MGVAVSCPSWTRPRVQKQHTASRSNLARAKFAPGIALHLGSSQVCTMRWSPNSRLTRKGARRYDAAAAPPFKSTRTSPSALRRWSLTSPQLGRRGAAQAGDSPGQMAMPGKEPRQASRMAPRSWRSTSPQQRLLHRLSLRLLRRLALRLTGLLCAGLWKRLWRRLGACGALRLRRRPIGTQQGIAARGAMREAGATQGAGRRDGATLGLAELGTRGWGRGGRQAGLGEAWGMGGKQARREWKREARGGLGRGGA